MVVISNGHSKFILGPAAVEAQKRAILDAYITAGYPTRNVKWWVRILGLGRLKAVRRLLHREENISESLIHPLWTSELIEQIGGLTRRIGTTRRLSEYVEDYALRLYAWQAARIVRTVTSKIYHYRSGYGHHSVRVAKQQGMIALCDHSIAHPAVLQYLIENGGRLPSAGQRGTISRFWSHVLEDIEQADCLVVNSDFVKETFLNQDWNPGLVHVAYTGVDRAFLDAVPNRSYTSEDRTPVKLLFAGEFGPRKGADILIRALERISDLPWQIEVVGEIDPEIRRKFSVFFCDPRVIFSGVVARLHLAQRMNEADVFVFPSLAEGSARVVFMALACGCYVITTPNSGSIVVDNVHGALVPPGEVNALEEAIRKILKQRDVLAAIGRNNASVIRSTYTQAHYGDSLFRIYSQLINK